MQNASILPPSLLYQAEGDHQAPRPTSVAARVGVAGRQLSRQLEVARRPRREGKDGAGHRLQCSRRWRAAGVSVVPRCALLVKSWEGGDADMSDQAKTSPMTHQRRTRRRREPAVARYRVFFGNPPAGPVSTSAQLPRGRTGVSC